MSGLTWRLRLLTELTTDADELAIIDEAIAAAKELVWLKAYAADILPGAGWSRENWRKP